MRDRLRLLREPGPSGDGFGRGNAPRPEPGGGFGPPRGREPALRAPWPALALALALPLAYAAQVVGGDPAAAAERFGFRPGLLSQGGWTGLVTALFVHASWTHVIFNGLAALAFGAPVARRFGVGGAGPAAFAMFFLGCGVLGSLGFALWPGGSGAVLVGASGGVAGLMGAASRMMPPAGGRLAPFSSPPVLAMAGAWVAVNLVFAVTGLDLGSGGAPLAWQAHLAGYAAGLLLVAPALRLAGGRPAE